MIDLDEAMRLFKAGDRAPSGFSPMLHSMHGGWHKKVGDKWHTWYPVIGRKPHPHESFTHEQHETSHRDSVNAKLASKLTGAQKGALLFVKKQGFVVYNTYKTKGFVDGGDELNRLGRVSNATLKSLVEAGLLKAGQHEKDTQQVRLGAFGLTGWKQVPVSHTKYVMTDAGMDVLKHVT